MRIVVWGFTCGGWIVRRDETMCACACVRVYDPNPPTHPPPITITHPPTYRVIQRLVEVVLQRPQEVPQALRAGRNPCVRPRAGTGPDPAGGGGERGGRGEGPAVVRVLVRHAEEAEEGGGQEDGGGDEGREARGEGEEVAAERGAEDPRDGDGRLLMRGWVKGGGVSRPSSLFFLGGGRRIVRRSTTHAPPHTYT